MPFLVDGYNLLHALGLLHQRVGPTGLRKARLALLGMLHGAFGPEASSITVVFDAAHAPPDAVEEDEYQGIHVRFAIHQDEADELIEELIRREAAPRRLIVVSDDRRLQRAARQRQCQVQHCAGFMEDLAHHRPTRRPERETMESKPERLTEEETAYWLHEFAELRDDPDLKELSDPPEWGQIES
jgi:predicted RNA-binding protein with PIN domain